MSCNIHLCVLRSLVLYSNAAVIQLSLIVVTFNKPLLVMQVDIGIPHELWDKPSAEVKKIDKPFQRFKTSKTEYRFEILLTLQYCGG